MLLKRWQHVGTTDGVVSQRHGTGNDRLWRVDGVCRWICCRQGHVTRRRMTAANQLIYCVMQLKLQMMLLLCRRNHQPHKHCCIFYLKHTQTQPTYRHFTHIPRLTGVPKNLQRKLQSSSVQLVTGRVSLLMATNNVRCLSKSQHWHFTSQNNSYFVFNSIHTK